MILTSFQIWSTSSLTCLYIVHPWAESYAGDVFSVTWLSSAEMLHFGCQNTSIQFLECSGLQSGEMRHPGQDSFNTGSMSSTPPVGSLNRKSKVHKFFNSYPQYERKPADELARNGTPPTKDVNDLCVDRSDAQPVISLEVPAENVIDSAHYGYIYCMAAIVADTQESQHTSSKFSRHLVTGSGDETLKVS
jgi:di- and tripeptidase